MSPLDMPAGLVRGTPGIYRLSRPPAQLARRLQDHDWTVGRLSKVTDRAGVLTGIGQALGFPDFYGQNLDALWDCLTDLTGPTVLIWEDWQDFAVYHAEDWARLRQVLGDRVTELPPFAVVLV
ncbi:MAG: barstar family protein [Propionibacteriaceae bacterium]|nr:barstar family protein [Propionibacteriaceae bacterium]